MDTNKPMALRLADKYEHEGFLSDHKFAQNQWCYQAAAELRRLHAENTALHQQLAAIGAGGVEPLRKTDTAARGTYAQIIKERELCAYAFAGALVDGLSSGTGPDTQESEWLRPAFEAGQEIAQLRAEIDKLRKRECLHQIIKPAPSEWDVRGHLAASLTCWPRLTEQEAAELVALFQGRPYPPLPDCKYTQSGDIKDFGLYSTAQMLAYVAADRAACYEAQAKPVDAELMRDAERYRWLRNMNDWHAEPRIEDADGTKWQLTFYTPQIIEDQSDDNNLDSAIDAARADA